MPTQEIFARYPPFPSEVPSIDLKCLSFTKLLNNDAIESKKLFEASQDTGFFLIDLKGSKDGETMLEHARTAFELNKKIHDLEQAELKQYAFKPPTDLYGYKSAGDMKLEDGSPDRMAFYNLSQDDILGNVTPRANPQIVESHRQTFKDFFVHGHHVLSHILTHLDTHLDLPIGTLASFSPLDKASGTSLRLLKALPSGAGSKARTDLVGHTDMGSITMLFNVVGGLQILPPSAPQVPADSDWRFVRPVPNCALINLGDAMVQWSGGIVRSNMHRVTTAPGRQKGVERFSVAYLVRPALETSMRRLVGGKVIPAVKDGEEEGDISAQNWERARAAQIIKGENKPGSVGGRTMKREVGMAKVVAD